MLPTKGCLKLVCAAVAIGLCVCAAGQAKADQGGIGYWLPGAFGSLAATPLKPGWSLAYIYLPINDRAGGNVAASRAIALPNRTINLNVSLQAELKARTDLGIFSPTYVFEAPVLGGQLAVTMLGIYGHQQANIDAQVTGALGPIGFATQRSVSQALDGFGDVFVQPTLRWNQGVNNYMVYAMTSAPVGAYDKSRLVNLGLGHTAIDAGGGYTYFNPQSGWEYSGVLGFTYNFENHHIDYQNGVDMHFDWGVSKFTTKYMHVGLVGYAYQQVTGDSGAGATFGDFKSRVFGIGPQMGFLFPVGDNQGYLNLKVYKEFGAENRPEGWNAWITFAISPAAPAAPSRTRM